MAENGLNSGVDFSGGTGIPSGLNRIKIRSVPSKKDRSSFKAENSVLRPPIAERKTEKNDHGKILEGKEGFRKGKKIARWFTSHLTKDSHQISNDILPNTKVRNSEVKMFELEGSGGTNNSTGKGLLSPESTRNVPKGFKSFSHELGPKGGIRPSHPRAHSYDDLKEMLGSMSSRFDAAKVVVDAELASFLGDVEEMLGKNCSSSPKRQETMTSLLILAQQCIEMTSSEFRAKCEGIVQDLAEKRRQCQVGLMKQLFTRMLFILTRCTRLLQFDKDSEPIDEDSLHKFKRCLESIPTVEMSWVPKQRSTDFDSDDTLNKKDSAQYLLQGKDIPLSPPERAWCRSEERKDSIVRSNEIGITKSDSQRFIAPLRRKFFSSHQEDNIQQCHQVGSFDGSDTVICRICEDVVPTSHLESHSYVCAYADKCDLKCSNVDERLSKLADVLEQIIESCTLSHHNALNGSPEISRIQTANFVVGSEGQSPKIIEWHSKGVEGMFEDLHEMDTACIDDSQFATSSNFKSLMGMKLGHHGAPSSTGSVTSVSSTNTPRTSHFDLFWLENNNTSETEDVHQMIDLAEIARCVASTDLTKEGASEFLLACMHDLQDILLHSKLEALVIDTFGSRIENLVREKCLLTCELLDNQSPNNVSKYKEGIGCLVDDSASQSSTFSTPVHPTHKEKTSIDDFEIIKPISRGAYGKVFLARKRTTGDLFAIKVLKKLDMIRKNDIERILAERNILITVRNPFVVRFFYSFSCRDNLYLVMEYLNGGDLYSLLRKVGCLEEDVARTYIAELVLALEYLHSRGIVHRDLKPDNILIAHDGHIKLTDFGLSKIGLINSTVDLSGSEANGTVLDADDLHTSFEHTQQTGEKNCRSAVGTPDYLAPEILLGTEHGYAADWWSVGIILFEFITGIPPFTAESPEIIFDNILNMKIPWPVVPTDMSYEAQDLISRCLINDPDQRIGVNGAAEVKAHPFFKGVNWDTLALQKAAFVPSPDSADDTSYFMSRYSQSSNGIQEGQNFSDSASDTTDSCSNSELEMDECGELADFDSSPLDLSLINFSFKNLSQLASINYDVLLQRDPSNSSSPSRGL